MIDSVDSATINYRDEIIRKMVHLCSLSIPITYYFISRYDAIIILSILTITAVIIDVSRYFNPTLERMVRTYLGFMMREHEWDRKKKNLNGATYVFISALACAIIFPKVFFITGFVVLIISDTSAALIGRKFGKNKFLAKSLEGTLAFFITAVVVVFLTPKITGEPLEYLIGIIAVAVGAIVENISFGIADDNLSIPMSIGLTMWGLYLIFFPGLELVLVNVPR